MAGTLTIPMTTLAVGTRDSGPLTLAGADTLATLTIDRTVSGGLNSLTSSSTLHLHIVLSDDGGATWQTLNDAGIAGGIILDKHGATVTANVVTIGLIDPHVSRRLKATIDTAGTSVAVSGSLVIT